MNTYRDAVKQFLEEQPFMNTTGEAIDYELERAKGNYLILKCECGHMERGDNIRDNLCMRCHISKVLK